MRCPECGGTVTLGDGKMMSAPKLALTRANPLKATGEFLRDVPAREYRTVLPLVKWAGCNSCEWCGPVSAAEEG